MLSATDTSEAGPAPVIQLQDDGVVTGFGAHQPIIPCFAQLG
jgi:hypothetical protein